MQVRILPPEQTKLRECPMKKNDEVKLIAAAVVLMNSFPAELATRIVGLKKFLSWLVSSY